MVVFARDPVPGTTKTRLVPVLGPASAADLYQCFLQDRLDQLAAIEGIRRVVAFTPDDADLSPLLPADGEFELMAQGEGDLTDRLVRMAAAAGPGPVVFMDSDSPTLPPAFVAEAARSITVDGEDCVLGPAEDGGYYLIGLREPTPDTAAAVFGDIQWSTDTVLAATLVKAQQAGLSVRLLPSWWDVDEPHDLDRLRGALHAAAWPPRTAEWLRELPLPRRPDRPASPEDPWVRQASRLVYGNRWIRLREDRVRLPNGHVTPYGVVEPAGPGAVGVLPFLDPDTVLMVRQYRYVSGRTTWEMPTGAIDPGETPEAAARRELMEEAGHTAATLRPLGGFVSSKSVLDERVLLYLGEDLTPTPGAHADPTEIIEVHPLPWTDVLQMVLDCEIEDSMTAVAVLRTELLRRDGAS